MVHSTNLLGHMILIENSSRNLYFDIATAVSDLLSKYYGYPSYLKANLLFIQSQQAMQERLFFSFLSFFINCTSEIIGLISKGSTEDLHES